MDFNKKRLPLAVLAALAIAQPGLTRAQEDTALEEVLVTGTLIRGAEVTGSQEIGLDTEAITDLGARTTSEMLASVPQVSNYARLR